MYAAMLHESGGRGRPIREVLNSGPERRLFQTAAEVKAYLAEEKVSVGPLALPLTGLIYIDAAVSFTV